jgi:hypothetical protein
MLDRIRKIFFIIAFILIVIALIVEKAFETGFGLRGLTLLEVLLVFAILLVALSLILPERIHGRLQGIATLIVSFLVALASFFCIIAAFVELMIMLALLMAVPFGTMVYLAVFGDFDRHGASLVLASGMTLKLFFCGFLVAAQERYLQNKGLVLLILSSLLGTLIVQFLHNLVPIILVSITDAVGGIVMGIITLLWGLWFFLRSIPSIIKVLMVWRSA